MFALVHVGRFQKNFVIGQFEVGMQERHPETLHLPVLEENASDFFQASAIPIINRAHISDVAQRIPLHGLNNNLVHNDIPIVIYKKLIVPVFLSFKR